MGFWKKLKKRLKPPKRLRKAFKKFAGKALKGLIGGIPIVGGLAKQFVNVGKLFGKAKKKVKKAIEEGISIKANIKDLDINLENMPNIQGMFGSSGKIKKLIPIILGVIGLGVILSLLKRK